jgi:ParB/RepB/Spo0J family partition protein
MKNTQLKVIAINNLIAHPDNPNVMSGEKFRKLVRNIERTGLYEPIIVRPHPENKDKFQIINGHHRVKALEKLGRKEANCVVWNVDDKQTAILLTTLNRLSGTDVPAKKIELLAKLKERFDTAELAKLLPNTRKQIEQLTSLKLNAELRPPCAAQFAIPLMFFVNSEQNQIIENALNEILHSFDAAQDGCAQNDKKTKAQQRAAAITEIARRFSETEKSRIQSGSQHQSLS